MAIIVSGVNPESALDVFISCLFTPICHFWLNLCLLFLFRIIFFICLWIILRLCSQAFKLLQVCCTTFSFFFSSIIAANWIQRQKLLCFQTICLVQFDEATKWIRLVSMNIYCWLCLMLLCYFCWAILFNWVLLWHVHIFRAELKTWRCLIQWQWLK